MRNIGFDPGARVWTKRALDGLFETVLRLRDDGTYLLLIHDERGVEVGSAELRADFLDEAIAQARAREADAA